MTPVRLISLMTITAAVLVVAATAPSAGVAARVVEPVAARTSAPLQGDLKVHDPALLAGGEGRDWYVFSSGDANIGGGAIQIRRSRDGRNWVYAGTIWDKMPGWLTDIVPGANTMWAPDIYVHDGTYYLYYAVSTTGHNNSVIALATNTTLDPADPNYRWVDQGRVLRSMPASNFNAIDPGVVEDASGTPWLVFGSYWTGIYTVQLEWPTGKRSSDKRRLPLADRKISLNAIEAPNVVRHHGWYYLFTSWDRCCRGTDSNYKIAVGRSRDVTGPYVDKDGRKLLDGGGTVVLQSSGNRIGPGGQSISGEHIAYHFYDARTDGAPQLAVREVSWTEEGWPELTNAAS
jgi:arabinan endo-1,5-alpha-L-arabinosidase